MTLFQLMLVSATLLCSLVAGFLFAFAVVVMPGIRSLNDGDFLQAFRVIDRVIQNNQPLFMVVWVGSALALIAAVVLGMGALSGADRLLAIAAGVIYIVGVHLPTVTINVPLNNQLQKLDPGAMPEAARKQARGAFEQRWNRWNVIRTWCASVVSVLLLFLLLRA
jgi:uncharacterized membrane protein